MLIVFKQEYVINSPFISHSSYIFHTVDPLITFFCCFITYLLIRFPSILVYIIDILLRV